MKKYIQPQIEIQNFEFENLLVVNSDLIDIGGTTDHFDTSRMEIEEENDDPKIRNYHPIHD